MPVQDWGTTYATTPPRAPGPKPPTTTPPPAGILTIPGAQPDYQALIAADPSYMSYMNNAHASIANAASTRRAALRALVVQYGGLPTGLDRYGDLDPGTLSLAEGNQNSDLARLDNEFGQNTEAFKRQLAARGALQSGDLGYGLDQINQQRSAAEYDQGNQFAEAFRRAIGDYSNAETGVYAGQPAAIAAAEQAIEGNPSLQPAPNQSATLDPDWQKKYGQPVYSTPDGSLYIMGPNGPSPYTAGASAAPPAAGADDSAATIAQAPAGTDKDLLDWMYYRMQRMHAPDSAGY